MKPKVVVLENIHEAGLQLLYKSFDVHESFGLSQHERLQESKDANVIIVKSVTKVNKAFIDSCPNLKIIARAGTGLDNIDCEYAKSKEISVLSVPTGNTKSAADFTLLLILASIRRLQEITSRTQGGDFRRHLMEGRELSELTVGLVGLGNVGIEVFKRLNGFDCKVKAYDPFSQHKDKFQSLGGVVSSSLSKLLQDVDVLSLHCSLTKDNFEFINNDFINKLENPIYLINTARGGLVNEAAIIKALDSGKLLFYAADLLSEEPPFDLTPDQHDFQNPLIMHEKSIITPHVAASTIDAQKKISIVLVNSILQSI